MYTIQDSASFPGQHELLYQTNALEDAISPGGVRRFLSFDAADVLNADTEMLTLFEPYIGGSIHTDMRLYLRGSGTAGNETAYFFTNDDNDSGTIALYKYVNGVMTADLAKQIGVPLQTGNKYFARVRAEGNEISAKLWPYGGIEPLDWDLNATDNSITVAGLTGIGIFPKNDYGKFFQASVAWNGGTANPVTSDMTTSRFNLTNMDAESGNTSGWVNEFGNMVVDETYQRSGTSCFAGSAANWRGYRRIDMAATGVTQDQIRNGAFISFSAWQRVFASENGPGRIGIRFLDTFMTEISTILSPWDNNSVTYARKQLVEQIPSNAAYVDLILEGQYVAGASAGAYFDDMEAGYSYKQ
jgi:hypothetical protein